VSIGITTDSYIVFFERVKEEVHAARPSGPRSTRLQSALRTLLTADSVTFIAALISSSSPSARSRASRSPWHGDRPRRAPLPRPHLSAGAFSHAASSSPRAAHRHEGALEGTGSHGHAQDLPQRVRHRLHRAAQAWLGISAVLVAISVAPDSRHPRPQVRDRLPGRLIFKVPSRRRVSVPDLKTAIQNAGVPNAEVQIFTDSLPPHARSPPSRPSRSRTRLQTKVLDTLSRPRGRR